MVNGSSDYRQKKVDFAAVRNNWPVTHAEAAGIAMCIAG